MHQLNEGLIIYALITLKGQRHRELDELNRLMIDVKHYGKDEIMYRELIDQQRYMINHIAAIDAEIIKLSQPITKST